MGGQIGQKTVKVLQVTIGDGNYGGVASFMYSYYSHMDQRKIHCDFLYCGENSMQSKMDSPVLTNSKITIFHSMKAQNNGIKEYRGLLKKLKNFFDENQYDFVHINTSNVLVSVCIIYAVKKRSICVAHSHNTKAIGVNQDKMKALIKDIMKVLARNYILRKADYFFACSKAAGINLYGKRALKSSKFRLIRNAVDLSMYAYNPSVRARVRKTDKIVIGHVGRLIAQKNPFFLIDVFTEIHRINPDTELWMVGEGELLEDVRKKIEEVELADSVVLWGRRNDVAELMQAMDIFILPSFYEGLSIVAVEAQAAGLPVYASDSISEEHGIVSLVQFLPLELGAGNWGKKIADDLRNLPVRRDMTKEMRKSGYEINQAGKWLEEFYLSVGKNK